MPEGSFIDRLKEFIATPRGKIIAAAVLTMVVLIVFSVPVLFFLLSGRLFQPSEEAVHPSAVVKKVEPGEKKKSQEKVVESFEVYEYKDPFKSLVTVAATGTAGGTTTATGGGGVTGPTTLALEEVYSSGGVQYAQIKYAGTVYRVKEGQQIDDSPYKVLSIGSSSVTLLYGDDRLTLRVGEEIVK